MGNAEASALRAGAACTDITPWLGVTMAGYASREGGAEEIGDPRHARALVLQSGDDTLALIATDLIGIHRGLADEVRAAIETELGIPRAHVMLGASHTHFGPEVRPGDEQDDEPAERWKALYSDTLLRRLVDVVRAAQGALEPARVGAARGAIEGVSFNRRTRKPDGQVTVSFRYPEPDADLTFGPLDTELRTLRVESMDGALIAAVVNFACHAVCSVDRMYTISADWPGRASSAVESVLGGVCLCMPGCSGDIVPRVREGWAKEKIGGSVAGEAIRQLLWIEASGEVDLSAQCEEVALPLKDFGDAAEHEARVEELEEAVAKAGPDTSKPEDLGNVRGELAMAKRDLAKARKYEGQTGMKTWVQALRIGDIRIVGLPGEILNQIGVRIKQDAPAEHCLVMSLCNDSVGYVPVRDEYPRGGYEVQSTPFAPGADDLLVETAAGLTSDD
jgi:neutral ceramidase